VCALARLLFLELHSLPVLPLALAPLQIGRAHV
jgi:hypothetical protein